MPLTTLQKDVLAVLAGNRSEESHFAGGIVLNAAEDSARFSHDFDILHELAEEVARASHRHVESLRHAGFQVETPSRYGEWEKDATFRKAKVSRGNEVVEIDWAADSAFRFFPIERDPRLGWRLHLFDIATNKALALSARTETRDYVDIVELHKTYLLPAICWAACGKDPGFSPVSLLKMMKRFARIDPAKLEEIQARALDPVALKRAWIEMSDDAEAKRFAWPMNGLTCPSAWPSWTPRSSRAGLATTRRCACTRHPCAAARRRCMAWSRSGQDVESILDFAIAHREHEPRLERRAPVRRELVLLQRATVRRSGSWRASTSNFGRALGP